jgi:hypothetical protein
MTGNLILPNLLATGDISASGDAYISGKLTVDGLIDPTGLELTQVTSNPGGVPDNTLWIDSGTGDLMFGDFVLNSCTGISVGGGGDSPIAVTSVGGVTDCRDYAIVFSITDNLIINNTPTSTDAYFVYQDSSTGDIFRMSLQAILDLGGGGGSGTASPGGVNQSVQFNDNGSFGGDSSFRYDGNDLFVPSNVVVGTGITFSGPGSTIDDITSDINFSSPSSTIAVSEEAIVNPSSGPGFGRRTQTVQVNGGSNTTFEAVEYAGWEIFMCSTGNGLGININEPFAWQNLNNKDGKMITIKDVDGNASNGNITINFTSDNLGSEFGVAQTSYTINTDYGSITLVYSDFTNTWEKVTEQI